MNVDAAARGNREHGAGQDEPVRRDDDDVGSECRKLRDRRRVLEGSGLGNGQAKALRQRLYRARLRLKAAPGGAVGLGEHKGDFMARRVERLECRGSEVWCSGEDDFQRGQVPRPERVRDYIAARCCFLSFATMRCCFSRERYSTNTLPSR
jgi:hypothetical protein